MLIKRKSQEKKVESHTGNTHVAWLFPSLERGNYWHPILNEFTNILPHTTVFTGGWTGFSAGFEDTFAVEVVGKTHFFYTTKPGTGYSRSYILPSLDIIGHLLRFKPDVIFTSAFSLWTAIAIFFKFLFGTRVIIVFDGVSAATDHLNSGYRVFARRIMTQFVDAFITNSCAGKSYLTKVVMARESRIFVKPYLVPDAKALLQKHEDVLATMQVQQPVFLYVGQVITRKGIHLLLKAYSILNEKGYSNYTLLIVGDGDQRQELEALTQNYNLQNCVRWIGQVDYHRLGAFFCCADVFVFPTLEDIWGMVVLEAMAFSKPILCSQWAGAAEMVINGKNGYIFDPYHPEKLAELLIEFIKNPDLIGKMGNKSNQIIANHTPTVVANFLTKVMEFTLDANK